ncbi:MAG: hypothetical protein SFT91_00875 [Rickettsiaceae bacterium]|nr:hypothetical protein [Rickettsiaceae bacterium]
MYEYLIFDIGTIESLSEWPIFNPFASENYNLFVTQEKHLALEPDLNFICHSIT